MLKSLLPTFTRVFLHSIYRTGASNYLSCYPLICRRKTSSSNFTDLHIITLPSLPGEMDTEERGYINASQQAGSSCSITGSDGIFSLPSQSCANLELELSNYSPIEFANACTTHNASDDVRQENMATVLDIPLKCFKRKRFIHSTIAELKVSMAVYFLYRNSANDDL